MERLTHIHIPAMACSFPVMELHPLYQPVKKEMDDFVKGFAASKAYNEKELELLVAQMWPFLACVFWPRALASRLPWMTKFLCWVFLLDDEADNIEALGADGETTAALMHKYIEVSQGSKTQAVVGCGGSGKGRDCMLLDWFMSLWEHLRVEMTPTQYDRLSQRLSTAFTHITKQSKLREEGTVLTPTELLDLERVVGFVPVLIPLMEYGAAIELEEHILNLPEIQEIEVACSDYMVISNDIFSFRKEYNSGDFNNLPSAFCLCDKSMDLQTAVDLTSELLKDVDRRFCELHASISKASYFTPQVKAFIDGLGLMMSGSLEWSWRTARYHGVHWVAPPTYEREGIMYLEDPPRFKPSTTPLPA